MSSLVTPTANPNKRRHQDMMKLMMSDYEVLIPDESCMHDFYVKFDGPPETPYENGSWKIHVTLPADYPFKSPSIGFKNRMFHPNVDDISGSVCLDVINQTWSPMFNLVNIFEQFLPQLLRYPNPTDPLNGEAAALLMRDPDAYNLRIRDHVRQYASAKIDLLGRENDVADDKGKERDSRAACVDVSGTSPGGVAELDLMEGTAEAEEDDGNESDISEMSSD
mmetsp:Transcript_9696/g.17389  ORF Transcript_9696/g.17389 Transcript_9696/m.17389 type:complete len:222 (+) Transcript_9696:144-809(+)|eukprot:CAMPEP_0205924190 /NCGR_PEP_ID=MMETSP1325-20131115/16831_1 /ASSEMBLY_ACC=CAM_ASM_000708 /TAXON_ID=236786 /ORGANISM="Florenciella sp., Strain RCC1007" /LENGTH=221 /DNA_ID=CAMNT_0053292517 /DNA_START=144 /DNA_END=809 /DNA_ORIENTATION=-